MNYEDYLRTPWWYVFRKQILKKSGYKCSVCGSRDCQLQVHHKNYDNLGHESANDVEVLCNTCHEKRHSMVAKGQAAYQEAGE